MLMISLSENSNRQCLFH